MQGISMQKCKLYETKTRKNLKDLKDELHIGTIISNRKLSKKDILDTLKAIAKFANFPIS